MRDLKYQTNIKAWNFQIKNFFTLNNWNSSFLAWLVEWRYSASEHKIAKCLRLKKDISKFRFLGPNSTRNFSQFWPEKPKMTHNSELNSWSKQKFCTFFFKHINIIYQKWDPQRGWGPRLEYAVWPRSGPGYSWYWW